MASATSFRTLARAARVLAYMVCASFSFFWADFISEIAFCGVEASNSSDPGRARLVLLQPVRIWPWRKQFCFYGLVGVAQADLARAVIDGLHDVVIALLMPAVTTLGSHRTTRIRSRVRMTNLRISFLLGCHLGRRLRQCIVSAIQTPALGGHGITPGIIGARSHLALSSFILSPYSKAFQRCEPHSPLGPRAHGKEELILLRRTQIARCEDPPRRDGRWRIARFPQTSQKTVTQMRGGDVRCDSIILSIESWVAIAFASRVCHHPAMANEKPNALEGKFAETLRKSREKRAGMKEQSQQRTQQQEESIQREEAKRADQTFTSPGDSES